MNKSFTLLDKAGNIQKLANTIIKFNYENKDYLIYDIDENEQNKQIFTSRLILNSEGKCFIENLLPEEKTKISNIIYNIVILTPTEYKKGNDANTLIDALTSKYSIKLSKDIPVLEKQEYYNNCSIAITSKELVELAIEFYDSNLKESAASSVETLIPTWTVPTEISSPKIEVKEEVSPITTIEAPTLNIDKPTVTPIFSNAPNNILDNENINGDSSVLTSDTSTPNVENAPKEEIIMPISNVVDENLPNPQKEKLAVVSDPSLSNFGIDPRGIQPNMQNVKKAGFAVNKHIIIGTICLVLAVAVVITAYFLIKNMK